MERGRQTAKVQSVDRSAVLGKDVREGRSRQPLGLWTPVSQMGKLPAPRVWGLSGSLGRGCGQASLLRRHTGHGPAPGP